MRASDEFELSANLPPRQPLPRPLIVPGKPTLKLGLDVHLEFIMAVAQRDHASPKASSKFTRDQLIQQIKNSPPKVGEITLVTLDGEVCDWGRFHNRK